VPGRRPPRYPAGVTADERPTNPLRGPLLRMSRFFLGGTLPRVLGPAEFRERTRDLQARRLPIRAGEARLLTKTMWCLLRAEQNLQRVDRFEALCDLAALALAIVEDDDLYVPDDLDAPTPRELVLLALELRRDRLRRDAALDAAIAEHGLEVEAADDLVAIAARLPADRRDPELERVVNRIRTHLGQGEELLAGQSDRQRAWAHRERLAAARRRAELLLGRLLAVRPGDDPAVLRRHVVRRELRRIEVDALGVERIGEAEQTARAKRLLAWTEDELGEVVDDANKDALAERVRAVAEEADDADAADGGSGRWFFEME